MVKALHRQAHCSLALNAMRPYRPRMLSKTLLAASIAAATAFLFLAPPALAASAVPWLYENSDVPPDPDWTFGELGNGLRFDGQVHGSMIDYDVSNAGATGAFDATRLVVSGGFSHRSEFGNGLILEPNLRATGTWEWQDGYTDSLAVAHAARAVNFGRLSTGVKVSKDFTSEGGTLTPFLGAAAEYRFSSGAIVGTSVLDGLSARIETGIDFTSNSGIGIGLHGEVFGLGLSNDVIATSVKANIAVPF